MRIGLVIAIVLIPVVIVAMATAFGLPWSLRVVFGLVGLLNAARLWVSYRRAVSIET